MPADAPTTPESSRGQPRLRWLLRRATLLLFVAVTAYTALIVLSPSWETAWRSPDARILIETASFCVAIFTALALYMPTGAPAERSRNGLIAALFALAISYAIMIVGFILVVAPSNTVGVMGLYGWIAARYLAGLLFIAGCLGRPRLPLRAYLLIVTAVVGATVAVCGLAAQVLPTPLFQTVDGVAVLTFSAAEHILISGVPAVLFGAGAVVAWRVGSRQVQSIYGWLAVALAVQSLSKVHELVYTATFGPVITSGDLLRIAMLVLLLAGAIVTVHQVAVDRVATIRTQQHDMAAVEEVYGSLARFAEQERLFRSVVVHELATPIAAVRAFAHALATARPEGDSTAVRQGIVDASRRLQELVDRMEELREIEGDDFAVDPQPTSVPAVLKDAASFAHVLPGDHRAILQCSAARAHADPVRLGQAVRNLVTNAAVYSPPGSPIILGCDRTPDGHVRVRVTDSGPGIPAEQRARLTAKYQRGAAARETGGAGLGLYIAERIAAAHGGRLILEEGPDGAGTSAVIELRGIG